jgi:hypothetical protein
MTAEAPSWSWTARSGLLSPSKSAIATVLLSAPVGNLRGALKHLALAVLLCVEEVSAVVLAAA